MGVGSEYSYRVWYRQSRMVWLLIFENITHRQTQMLTRTLCIRRTLCRHVTIGTPMVIFAVLAKKTIGVPIVTGLPRLYQHCTNSVPIVKNGQKTVKRAKMTTGVPIVTCLHKVRRIHKVLVRICIR